MINDCRNRVGLLLIFGCMSFVLLLAGCKPSVPNEFLQPDEMEDILYDYHIADAIARQQLGDDKIASLAFKESILRKHGTDNAVFDSSLVYYTRHTKLLHDVYESLSDRLSDEALSQGSTIGQLNRYGDLSSSADTADVWNGDKVVVLSPYPSFNNYSYEIKVDTAFHKGDKLLLDFDAQFIYQDGMRDAIAVLAIKFANDSVTSQTVRLSSTRQYHLQIGNDSLQIKSVKGYFMLNKIKETESSTTLKMMILSNIKLVRMHNKPSTKTDTKTDDNAKGQKADTTTRRNLPTIEKKITKPSLQSANEPKFLPPQNAARLGTPQRTK